MCSTIVNFFGYDLPIKQSKVACLLYIQSLILVLKEKLVPVSKAKANFLLLLAKKVREKPEKCSFL